MNEQTVQRVERIALVLVAVATLISLVSMDRAIFLGVGLGGALAAANFHALRRILQALFKSHDQKSSSRQAMLSVLLTIKFGLLAACIFLVVRYLPVNPMAFLAGISTVVLAIFVEGVRVVLRGGAEATSK